MDDLILTFRSLSRRRVPPAPHPPPPRRRALRHRRVRRAVARRPGARPCAAGWPGTWSGSGSWRRPAVIHPAAATGPLPRASATGPRRSSTGSPTRPSASPRRSRSPACATTTCGCPRSARTRARSSTSSGPRSSTRRRSAACSSATSSLIGVEATAANVVQALVYTLTTRVAAPGRDRYMLVLVLVIGLGSGWVTLHTGGIGAAFLGHAVTRLAVFLATGHAGQPARPRPRVRGHRAPAGDARRLARHRRPRPVRAATGEPSPAPSGHRSPPPDTGRPLVAPAPLRARRALRPRPVLRLALPVLRLRRRGGRRGARAGQPDRRVRGRPAHRDRPARRRARRAVRAAGRGRRAPRWRRSTSAAGRRRSCRPTSWPALIELVGERFGLAPGAEVTLEVNPGPDERGDAGRPAAGRRHAALARRPEPDPERAAHGSAGATGRATSRRDRRGRPRAAGSASVSLDLLYDMPEPDASPPGWSRSTRRSPSRPDHLSLYALTLDDPDAEGLTGPGRRPPADQPRAPAAGARTARPAQDDDRAAAMYHHAVVRLAEDGWRGYEISNWARPGHESRHNLAYWQRLPYEAVGPGAHAFDGRTRRWNAARLDAYVAALTPAGAGARRACRRAAPRRSTRRRPRPRRSSSGLRTDAGLASAAFAGPGLAETLAWARELELVSAGPGRPDPAHDPRPAALQRALRAARLTPARRAAGDGGSRRDPARLRRPARRVDTPAATTATMPATIR